MSSALPAATETVGQLPMGGVAPLGWRGAAGWGAVAVVCFHGAFAPAGSGPWALAMLGYLLGVIQLARLKTARSCFYSGLALGVACGAPQLAFFWTLFGPSALCLWLILAFWIGLFVTWTHEALVRWGLRASGWIVPVLWTGLEYFRSELYPLRFSWLNVGYAFAQWSATPLHWWGMYGIGFLAAGGAALWFRAANGGPARRWLLIVAGGAWFVVLSGLWMPRPEAPEAKSKLRLAGVQLEFPSPLELRPALDRLFKPAADGSAAPDFDVAVLSEYTLDGPPTEPLRQWCRDHGKYLVVGGKDFAPGTNYYNTAYVVGTNGAVVFQQVKRVPIQFFKDGLPAPSQALWHSPWGDIGICICYDLSYTRVTDALVRQGARLLIVPTMDVVDWGRHQHELHARVAPVRAAEYGIPIFRLASSGISQGVDCRGVVQASARFDGAGESLRFGADLSAGARPALPLDRWLAPACTLATAGFGSFIVVAPLWRKYLIRRGKKNP